MQGREVYKGNIFSVKEMVNEGTGQARQAVEHQGAAGALVVKDDQVIFVKQFRDAIDSPLIEIPAGLLQGEHPDDVVRREMYEEVGATGGQLEKLHEFYTSAGFSNETFHLYLLKDPELTDNNPEEFEELEIVSMPFVQALEMAQTGKIKDAKTIIALLMAKERL